MSDEHELVMDRTGDDASVAAAFDAGEGAAPETAPVPSVSTDAEPAGMTRAVMTARAPRWIGPPITAGQYMFKPGTPTDVLAEDAVALMTHTRLAELGVTFAVADAAAPAEEAQPAKRRRPRG